ncbi:alcohol dehydrogenase [Caballeronia temeraria]|uniref:Alcohol dehydrogenase n=1 Tax=Caballeronia temeraria TaxID=1777137 RepID=A0A158D6H2_9BURK|nr:alcohol dehydrogenase [Caballeronia temeraria]
MPGMKSGDVMGHEFMGAVVEVGRGNSALKIGDRVVVPFTIICGECDQCKRSNFSVCERSNRNKDAADKLFGQPTAALFGYTHPTGGYAGGQAEYVRMPFADRTHVKIPDGLSEAGGHAGDRPAPRSPRNDLRAPSGRDAFGAGRVWRTDRHDSVGRRDEQGAHLAHRQTHVNRRTDDLLNRIQEGQIDPSFVIPHRMRLEDGPPMYKTFRDKEDGCISVVFKPE